MQAQGLALDPEGRLGCGHGLKRAWAEDRPQEHTRSRLKEGEDSGVMGSSVSGEDVEEAAHSL